MLHQLPYKCIILLLHPTDTINVRIRAILKTLSRTSPGPLQEGSRVVPYKILRFAIQSGELL